MEDYNIDDLFDEDFEFTNNIETIEQDITIDELEEIIDESLFLFEETNIKNKLFEILQDSYNEKIISSVPFYKKIENYMNLIKSSLSDDKKCEFKNKISHTFHPLVKIRKNFINGGGEGELMSKSQIKYDANNFNTTDLLSYLNNIHSIANNKNTLDSIRLSRIQNLSRPFENNEQVNFTVCEDIDAIYIHQQDHDIKETTRLLALDDRVDLLGIANIINESDTYIHFNYDEYLKSIDQIEKGMNVYLSESMHDSVLKIEKNQIVLESGFIFNKEEIFSNSTLIYINKDKTNVYYVKDLFLKNAIIFIKDVSIFLSCSKIYIDYLNEEKLITNVHNIEQFNKQYPLLKHENLNSSIQNTIDNYRKQKEKSEKNKKGIRLSNFHPVYKILENKLVKIKSPNNKINEYKKYLESTLDEIRKFKKQQKEIGVDLQVKDVYNGLHVFKSIDEAIYNYEGNDGDLKLFKHYGKTYLLEKRNGKWIFNINTLKSNAPKGYRFDENKMMFVNIERNEITKKINKLELISSCLKDVIENFSIPKNEILDVDILYDQINIVPKPYYFKSNTIRDETGYMGDDDFIDSSEMYDTRENELYADNIELLNDEIDDSEIIKYVNENTETPKFMVNNVCNLMGLKISDKMKQFIINYLDYKYDTKRIENEINSEIGRFSLALRSKINNKESLKKALSKLKDDSAVKKNKLLADRKENTIYTLFSLLTIIIQIQLPEVSLNIANSLCKEKIGFMGYPINDKKTNTLISFLSCTIKTFTNTNVTGFSDFSKSNQEEISKKLQDNVKIILEENEVLKSQLEKNKKYLENISNKQKKQDTRYWSSFRPNVNLINNNKSTFLSEINKETDNKKLFVFSTISGKPAFVNTCCIRSIDDKVYVDVINESSALILKSKMLSEKIKTTMPIKYIKASKDNDYDFNSQSFKINTTKEMVYNNDNIMYNMPIETSIEKYNKINKTIKLQFQNDNDWSSNDVNIETLYSNLRTRMNGDNILKEYNAQYKDRESSVTIRDTLYKFMVNTLTTNIGRIVNDFKMDDKTKTYLNYDIRNRIKKIKEHNFKKYDYILESKNILDFLKGVSELYFESNNDIIVFKNTKVLLFVLLTILNNIGNVEFIKIILDLLKYNNNLLTKENIGNYFEQQREENKQQKMKQINSLNEEAREMYNQFKKNKIDISLLDIQDKFSTETFDVDMENIDVEYHNNVIDDFQDD